MPVYLCSVAIGIVVLILWARHGVGYDNSQTTASFAIFLVCAIAMVFIDVIGCLTIHRPPEPIAFLRERYVSLPTLLYAVGALPALAVCSVLIPIFSSVKAMIPLFNDFTWDPTFIALDRKLFFGHDAWTVLQPVLGYPPITAFLAVCYHLWVFLLYAGCIFFAAYRVVNQDTRRRFFLSYGLCWVLIGGVAATMLASVGPVFAKPLVGIDTFLPQMAYLHAANDQIPVMTLAVQDMLLARFATGDGSLGSGISAMPSMHVAIAVLFWLAMREVHPRASRFFGVFAAIIWIASIHLAYHYAVDGIVSLALVWLIWNGSRYIFAAWDRLPLPFPQPALRTNTVPAE